MGCCTNCDEPAAFTRRNEENDFDHKNDKYMVFCCCGPIHSTVATRILGLCLKILMWIGIYHAVERKDLIAALTMIVQMLFTVLLLFGIMFRRSWLVVPFLGWMLLILLGEAFLTLFCFGLVVIPYSEELQHWQSGQATEIKVRLLLIFVGSFFTICTFIQYWFFSITQRCYAYLKEFREHRRNVKYAAGTVESRFHQ